MIGIDLVSVERIKKIANKKFLEKTFHESEIKYFENYKNKYEIIAGHFSAKEAVMKLFDCCKTLAFKDILIYHNSNGKPLVKLFNNAEKEFREKYKEINISISHEKQFATAVEQIK